MDAFRRNYPHSEFESSVTYIAAKAALGTGLFTRTRMEVKLLKLRFPKSQYIDDGYMIFAECDLMTEEWESAHRNLEWVVNNSGDERLVESAALLLIELNEFQELQTVVRDAAMIPAGSEAKIGLILPLSTADAEAAKAFLHGFQARIREVANCNLVVYDSFGDPVRATRLARKLTMEDKVRVMVGGLDPAEAACLAAVAEADHVPFISTACRVGELTAIGRYVFQGRVNYTVIGKALGRHAFQELGLVDFGILAPVSRAGMQIVDGFKDAVTSIGGRVLAEEAYYLGAQDFSVQLKRIRKVGLRCAYYDSMRTFFSSYAYILVDSIRFNPDETHLQPVLPPPGIEFAEDEDTTWTLSDVLLDSLWKSDHARLNRWMTETKQEIDSLEIPLKVYDGFLLVIEPGAVEITAPQFARFNLRTQLLGDENWADRESHYRVRTYINGIVYAEPIAAERDSSYFLFSSRLSGSEQVELNVHHLEGERAARMVQFGLSRANDAESMRLALSQIRDLETLSGRISLLKEERVDRRVNLVQFKHGEYLDVGR